MNYGSFQRQRYTCDMWIVMFTATQKDFSQYIVPRYTHVPELFLVNCTPRSSISWTNFHLTKEVGQECEIKVPQVSMQKISGALSIPSLRHTRHQIVSEYHHYSCPDCTEDNLLWFHVCIYVVFYGGSVLFCDCGEDRRGCILWDL